MKRLLTLFGLLLCTSAHAQRSYDLPSGAVLFRTDAVSPFVARNGPYLRLDDNGVRDDGFEQGVDCGPASRRTCNFETGDFDVRLISETRNHVERSIEQVLMLNGVRVLLKIPDPAAGNPEQQPKTAYIFHAPTRVGGMLNASYHDPSFSMSLPRTPAGITWAQADDTMAFHPQTYSVENAKMVAQYLRKRRGYKVIVNEGGSYGGVIAVSYLANLYPWMFDGAIGGGAFHSARAFENWHILLRERELVQGDNFILYDPWTPDWALGLQVLAQAGKQRADLDLGKNLPANMAVQLINGANDRQIQSISQGDLAHKLAEHGRDWQYQLIDVPEAGHGDYIEFYAHTIAWTTSFIKALRRLIGGTSSGALDLSQPAIDPFDDILYGDRVAQNTAPGTFPLLWSKGIGALIAANRSFDRISANGRHDLVYGDFAGRVKRMQWRDSQPRTAWQQDLGTEVLRVVTSHDQTRIFVGTRAGFFILDHDGNVLLRRRDLQQVIAIAEANLITASAGTELVVSAGLGHTYVLSNDGTTLLEEQNGHFTDFVVDRENQNVWAATGLGHIVRFSVRQAEDEPGRDWVMVVDVVSDYLGFSARALALAKHDSGRVILAGGTFHKGSDPHLALIDASTGSLVSTIALPGFLNATHQVAVQGQSAYLSTGYSTAQVALDSGQVTLRPERGFVLRGSFSAAGRNQFITIAPAAARIDLYSNAGHRKARLQGMRHTRALTSYYEGSEPRVAVLDHNGKIQIFDAITGTRKDVRFIGLFGNNAPDALTSYLNDSGQRVFIAFESSGGSVKLIGGQPYVVMRRCGYVLGLSPPKIDPSLVSQRIGELLHDYIITQLAPQPGIGNAIASCEVKNTGALDPLGLDVSGVHNYGRHYSTANKFDLDDIGALVLTTLSSATARAHVLSPSDEPTLALVSPGGRFHAVSLASSAEHPGLGRANHLAVGEFDLNDQHQTDFAVASWIGTASNSHAITLLNRDGTEIATSDYPKYPIGISAADIDHDGQDELLVGTQDGKLVILKYDLETARLVVHHEIQELGTMMLGEGGIQYLAGQDGQPDLLIYSVAGGIEVRAVPAP